MTPAGQQDRGLTAFLKRGKNRRFRFAAYRPPYRRRKDGLIPIIFQRRVVDADRPHP